MAVSTLCQQQKLPSLCAYLSATVSRCQGICAAAASAVRNLLRMHRQGRFAAAGAGERRAKQAGDGGHAIHPAGVHLQSGRLSCGVRQAVRPERASGFHDQSVPPSFDDRRYPNSGRGHPHRRSTR